MIIVSVVPPSGVRELSCWCTTLNDENGRSCRRMPSGSSLDLPHGPTEVVESSINSPLEVTRSRDSEPANPPPCPTSPSLKRRIHWIRTSTDKRLLVRRVARHTFRRIADRGSRIADRGAQQ